MSHMRVFATCIPFTRIFLAHKRRYFAAFPFRVVPLASYNLGKRTRRWSGASTPNPELRLWYHNRARLTLKMISRHVGFCFESFMFAVLSDSCTFLSAQGTMIARRMLSGAPLASSSRLLSSQLLVQSFRDLVSTAGAHEHFPSPTSGRSNARHVSNLSCSRQPPLWQRNPFSLVKEQSNCGRAWSALGASKLATDAAPAPDVTPEDVLHFWFKDADLAKNEFPMEFWFMGGEAADKEITERFGECLEMAIQGKLDHWKETPRGRVALVLVLDQFSRNCYRDSGRAFAQDETALKITSDSVEQGLDLQLSNPLERYFLYMPLMHCEVPEVHVEAQRLFRKLADEHKDNPELYKMLQYVVKFEKAHSAILNKFGRYPSRNALLGRKSTPQEEEYLASGVTWPMED